MKKGFLVELSELPPPCPNAPQNRSLTPRLAYPRSLLNFSFGIFCAWAFVIRLRLRFVASADARLPELRVGSTGCLRAGRVAVAHLRAGEKRRCLHMHNLFFASCFAFFRNLLGLFFTETKVEMTGLLQ